MKAEAKDCLLISSCMAGHIVGGTGISDSGHSNQHIPYPILNGVTPLASNFINHQGTAFDFGELEEALVLQGVKTANNEARNTFFTTGTAATLEMFPSWPIRFRQGSSKSGESTDSGSALNTLSCKADAQMEPESPISKKTSDQLQQEMASGPPRNQEAKSQEKTLRRLAQNREAARKSRMRKKAYVQQLESSRIKLAQLEQELQKARSQGFLLGGVGGAGGNISSTAAIFDMEYLRWLEDDHRHMAEIRTALQTHLPDGELKLVLDRYLAHYDEVYQLKGVAAKTDVFHIITGMWTTPAERCFLWMGGFRPSELIKILIPQLDTLTEQQFMGIYNLEQSSQQAEEALSQGLEQLQQSLVDTVASEPYIGQMAFAFDKVANLEGFVHQADNLRQQTLHQMRRILTVRQAARCFLAISEYYNRLRALSSL